MSRKVVIAGAGWAGTTLRRALRPHGIDARLVDKGRASDQPITIRKTAFWPVLDVAQIQEDDFRRAVAVQRCEQSPSGPRVVSALGNEKLTVVPSKYEDMLTAGLECERDASVDVSLSSDGTRRVRIRDSGEVPADTLLVAADGVHSQTRHALLPEVQQQVLPYVAINGKRKMTLQDFTEQLLPSFDAGKTVLEWLRDSTLIRLSYTIDNDAAYTSWTYSRPAKPSNDNLHRPNRGKDEASQIPDAFYDELAALHPPERIFGSFFAPEKVKQDRKLHWLMRSLALSDGELRRLAERRVVLLGDAAHGTPILGSRGAELAIEDALALAAHLREGRAEGDVREVARRFYEARARRWREDVADAEARIAAMHVPSTASL